MNGNKIYFTYDCASDSLVLKGASRQIVPVFDPAEISDVLRSFSKFSAPVESAVQVKLSDRKSYLMEIASDEPTKSLSITLSEISDC